MKAYEVFLRGKLGSSASSNDGITARTLGAAIAAYDRAIELDTAFAAWSAVEGTVNLAVIPFRAAMLSRAPARIALSLSLSLSLSPTLWPLDRRNPGDFPEFYVIAQAESLLLTEPEPARRLLEQIQARLQAQPDLYPGASLCSAHPTQRTTKSAPVLIELTKPTD